MTPLKLHSATALCMFALSAGLVHSQQARTAVEVAAADDTTLLPPRPPQAAAVVEEAGSGARIVRLSQVTGEVEMDRGNGRGYEAAYTNLPVVQQARLKTGEGTAEVEFEDNSTLRLTPNSAVEFNRLRLMPTGATVSSVRVVSGLVFVTRTGSKANEMSLLFGAQHAVLGPSAHVELSVAEPKSRLSVMDGAATLQDTAGATTATVAKKHSLVVDTADGSSPVEVAGVEKSPFDDWDKQAAGYHQRYANASAFGGTAAGYGTSDLNYYGSFADLPGCGQVWRPFFTSAAWDPFANGTWAFYQGAGYSFVSPYPWAWAPFHTGQWQQCGAGGWGWQPQGQWTGLNNRGVLAAPLHGKTHMPPHEPLSGEPTSVAIHAQPLVKSGLTSADTFVFSKDSAGLGVPRQTFGKLGGISAEVAHGGVVAAPVATYATLAPSRSQLRGTAAANPATLQHGSAITIASRGSAGMQTFGSASAGSATTGASSFRSGGSVSVSSSASASSHSSGSSGSSSGGSHK